MGFFILYFIIGLLIYNDYGISSDVRIERHTGLISAQYITRPTNDRFTKEFGVLEELSTYQDRYYGVAYQMPLAIMEFNAMIRNQSIWEFRQLMNFITFFIGVFAFFNLVTDLFNDPRFGLLGAFFLVSMPRIFAHAFFNPKDAVFLAVFIIALFFTIKFWKESTPSHGILAGVFCAYATNVRIIAISLVLITIGLLTFHYFRKSRKINELSFVIFMSSFLISLFLFWPASWQNPIRMLFDTIFLFSDFGHWDGQILYMGEFIRGANLPWHYLPVWMSLTIPPTLIVLFLYGAVITIKDSLKLRLSIFDQHQPLVQLISLCLVIFPVVMAIGLGSTLYNGWRHFYFIFAPFLLVVLVGIKSLVNVLCARKNIIFSVIFSTVLLIATGINSIGITLWNINNHPFQYAYFNGISHIVGRENFERDYWRISMKQGLTYLFQYDQNERFYVCTEPGGKFNALLFPFEESNRIRFINEDMQLSKCDYSITTYRYEYEFACPHHLYSIKVDNVPILSIFECEQ